RPTDAPWPQVPTECPRETRPLQFLEDEHPSHLVEALRVCSCRRHCSSQRRGLWKQARPAEAPPRERRTRGAEWEFPLLEGRGRRAELESPPHEGHGQRVEPHRLPSLRQCCSEEQASLSKDRCPQRGPNPSGRTHAQSSIALLPSDGGT